MSLMVCGECDGLVSEKAYDCPQCGYPLRSRPVLKRSSTDGVLSGLCGAAFAILGVFTLGLVFLPFAALFTLISLVRAVVGMSMSGLCAFLFSAILTGIGVAVSPTVWGALLFILGISSTHG